MIAVDVGSAGHRPRGALRERASIQHAAALTLPAVKAVLFVVGSVVLAVTATSMSNVGEWVDRWGAVPVLAGVAAAAVAGVLCFWSGARTIIGTLIGG